jgi:hypothetical protein
MLGGCEADQVKLTWDLEEVDGPVPYGFWGLNGHVHADGLADIRDRFGITVFNTATRHPNYAVTDLLPTVREAGLTVNLRLVGSHEHYTDNAGNFDLAAWKGMLEPWRDSGVREFADDGTLAWHMMLDDIDEFAGRGPTAGELEEMARTSQEIIPGLRTMVRADATEMPWPDNGYYAHVDACVNQYLASDGPVESYALAEVERARELGLEPIMGLNMAAGGDGSSGQPGWTDDGWAMSGDEIRKYGRVLSAAPGSPMFLAWEYDAEEPWRDGTIGADWFDRPEQSEALVWLGERLSGTSP